MKCTLAILAALATATVISASEVPKFGEGPLHDDLQDFLRLLPMEEISTVINEYMQSDKEFQKFVEIFSSVYKDLLWEVEAIPELIDFLNYLETHGIYAYGIVNAVNKQNGLPELKPPRTYRSVAYKITGGLHGFIRDIVDLIDFDKIVELHQQKMESSPAWVDFVNYILNSNYRNIVPKIMECEHFKILVEKMKAAGLISDFAAQEMPAALFSTLNAPFVVY